MPKSDGIGLTLYYLDNGGRQLSINATELPPAPFTIPQSGQNFYQIGINPLNNDILVTDAVDYVQPGYLLLYTNDRKFYL